MKLLVLFTLFVMTVGFWLARAQNENLGKNPNDEETSYTQERNKVTGELLNVQITRCLICGQVLSYFQCNLKGKLVHGYMYHDHHCGKYGTKPAAPYRDLGIQPLTFSIVEWLSRWQHRLRLRH